MKSNTPTKRKPYHPPHIYLDDTTYFITAKTLNRQPILAKGDRKAKFRNFLKAKLIKYEVKCSAWVILNEHYHLLIHIKNKSQLPRFIKSLHGESAIWLNKKDNATGRRVWYNYWDYIPRSESEFYTIFNYIHANPAKHGYLKQSISFLQKRIGVPLTQNEAVDFHDMLMRYPFSSYLYYAKKYGREGILQAWLDYPLAVHGKEWG